MRSGWPGNHAAHNAFFAALFEAHFELVLADARRRTTRTYRVDVVDGTGCEVPTSFRVSR